MNAEGGHWHNDAKYNPLNTTQSEPGAGNTGTQGNIKVYRNWNQGVDATVATLKNGRYGGIISALKSGNPSSVAHAIGASPWGTTADLVSRTIRSVPRPTGSVQGTPSPSTVPGSSTAQSSRTIPGQSFAQERAAATSGFLGQRGSSADQNLAFAQQFAQIPQDVAARTIAGSSSSGPSGQPSPGAGPSSSGGLASFARQRADQIDAQHLPYQWGGGHGGQTPLGKAVPLDCSGAVSKVLGIDPRVSGAFQSWGRPGDGGSQGVTVYSNSHHVIMKIDGHFWGTSGSNPGGGAGWIKADQISPQYLKGFTARHSNR